LEEYIHRILSGTWRCLRSDKIRSGLKGDYNAQESASLANFNRD
jgi:hypothetical protein